MPADSLVETHGCAVGGTGLTVLTNRAAAPLMERGNVFTVETGRLEFVAEEWKNRALALPAC